MTRPLYIYYYLLGLMTLTQPSEIVVVVNPGMLSQRRIEGVLDVLNIFFARRWDEDGEDVEARWVIDVVKP